MEIMSRIVVKNLPNKVTEERLREIFGEKGQVTDIQLKYTKEGKFRNFAYIGFDSEKEAEKAVSELNDTFIKINKISVEPYVPFGDKSKLKPWSKHSNTKLEDGDKINSEKKTNKTNDKIKKINKKKEKKNLSAEVTQIIEKYKDDPMFEEFLEVHSNLKDISEIKESLRSKKKSKSSKENTNDEVDANENKEETNEIILEETNEIISEDNEEDSVEKIACLNISDREYFEKLVRNGNQDNQNNDKPAKKEKKPKKQIELYTLKLRGLPPKCRKKQVKDFFRPQHIPYTIRFPRGLMGICYVGFKTEKQMKAALSKDKSFIGANQIKVTKHEIKTGADLLDDSDPRKIKWKEQEESLKNVEDIGESGKIFMRNLSYTVTKDDVYELFSKYGPIAELFFPVDEDSQRNKGFGMVTFVMPEHALKAYTELDRSSFHGRLLHLLPGRSDEKIKKEEDKEIEDSNYKKKKAAKDKEQSGSSCNWNSLFLAQTALVNTMIHRYKVLKQSIISPHVKGNPAVRLALGETQVVNEVKKYLEKEGVVLESFNHPSKKRSNRIIIAKNLQFGTTEKDLLNLFGKYGAVARVILPPHGLTGVIEFILSSEAKEAYKNLAYTMFNESPLYLEWAPENSLKEKVKVAEDESETPFKNEEVNNIQEIEPEEDAVLYVKNINFKTTDEDFRKHFEGCGEINYAKISTKIDKNNPGERLSMGFGFVSFFYKKSADMALKTLQYSTLDGKTLELQRSERTLKTDVKDTRKITKHTKPTGTKLIVRNVPFQANRKDLLELFSPYGQIKALRLPKKMTSEGSHRGFAFVDYVTENDAKRAYKELSSSTHLLGRRLVLEWASAEHL